MYIKLRISLQRLAIMLILLAAFVPMAIAQNQTDIPASSVPEWLRNHAAMIALIISEIMAFLPSKVSGIVKSIFAVFNELTKKKST